MELFKNILPFNRQTVDNPSIELVTETFAANPQSVILPTTRMVLERATHVHLDDDNIANLADRFSVVEGENNPPTWSEDDLQRHFFDGTSRTAEWLFVLSALNFSFWTENGHTPWTVRYNDETLKGYWALATALKMAQESGQNLANADFLRSLTSTSLAQLLGGSGDIPYLQKRVEVLNETGEVLANKFDGEFINVIEEANRSAIKLANTVALNFPSFYDVADYHGLKVAFLKRAQILAADLWGAFGGLGWGQFDDMDKLTIFADYRLPQMLNGFGAIHYSADLFDKIQKEELLPAGSDEEIEIRAATVQAANRLKDILAARGIAANALAIDWWLWRETQSIAATLPPHHKTRTWFY